MYYRFQKTYESSWFVDVEADSFEEAKEKLENEDYEWAADDGGESYLTSSRCLQYESEEAIEDGDDYEELEWEP